MRIRSVLGCFRIALVLLSGSWWCIPHVSAWEPDPAALADSISRSGSQSPVAVMIFLDLSCEPCQKIPELLKQLDSVYPERLQVIFRHAPSSDDPALIRAHEILASAEDAGKLWEMFTAMTCGALTGKPSDPLEQADAVGLDRKTLIRDLDSHRFLDRIVSDCLQAWALGIDRTPVVFINGYRFDGVIHLESAVKECVQRHKAMQTLPAARTVPVTVTMFIDLTCPYSRRMCRSILNVADQYPGNVHWVIRHFPLSESAESLHLSLLAAVDSGYGKEMLEALLREDLVTESGDLSRYYTAIGLDDELIPEPLEISGFWKELEDDRRLGDALGVMSVPTVFINCARITGESDPAMIREMIDYELNGGGGGQ
ncbi:MAG TPA: thioredoxin domain-containing protein [bacterium]|nr:thioredoxin domain-containing protein [bacterium]